MTLDSEKVFFHLPKMCVYLFICLLGHVKKFNKYYLFRYFIVYVNMSFDTLNIKTGILLGY